MISRIVPLSEREELMMSVLATVKDPQAQTTPLAVFVKKLQESLTRMESFDVTTVSSNSDGQFSMSDSRCLTQV